MTMSRQLRIIIFCNLGLSMVLSYASSWNDVLTVDEIPHVAAGYSYWILHNNILNPEHPPLVKDLASIPLLFLNLNNQAFGASYWTNDDAHIAQYEFGRELIYHSSNDADLITHVVHVIPLIFVLLGGLLIAQITFELYSPKASVLATILFAFSPTILAHGHLVTTDIPAMTGSIAAVYFFLRYLRAPHRHNIIIAGTILGLALLTKFSTLILLPFLALIGLLYLFVHANTKAHQKRLITGGLALVGIAFAMVWFVYIFHTIGYPQSQEVTFVTQTLQPLNHSVLANSLSWLSSYSVTRPLAHFFLGALLVIQHNSNGHPAYFLGTISSDGWWYYFPIVYFIKEPIAWWLLATIAVVSAFAMSYRGCKTTLSKRISLSHIAHLCREHFTVLTILIWLTVYWTISVTSSINIGIRHLLPIYPFVIILVSGQVIRLSDYLKLRSTQYFKVFTVVIAVLLGWYLLEAFVAFPSYIGYFNQAVGGSAEGYQYVADSNVDWGQDLKRLSQFVKANHIAHIELAYFSGWADPAYYLGDSFQWLTEQKYQGALDFKNRNSSDGWLAISVQYLQTNPAYAWLKPYTPTIKIGSSIFVYHF